MTDVYWDYVAAAIISVPKKIETGKCILREKNDETWTRYKKAPNIGLFSA